MNPINTKLAIEMIKQGLGITPPGLFQEDMLDADQLGFFMALLTNRSIPEQEHYSTKGQKREINLKTARGAGWLQRELPDPTKRSINTTSARMKIYPIGSDEYRAFSRLLEPPNWLESNYRLINVELLKILKTLGFNMDKGEIIRPNNTTNEKFNESMLTLAKTLGCLTEFLHYDGLAKNSYLLPPDHMADKHFKDGEPDKSIIYIVKLEGRDLIKIGRSQDVFRRSLQLKYTSRVLATLLGPAALERHVHMIFSGCKADRNLSRQFDGHNEIFHLNDESKKYLDLIEFGKLLREFKVNPGEAHNYCEKLKKKKIKQPKKEPRKRHGPNISDGPID